MGSRQAKLPRRVRAVMNAARCSEGPREAVACALVSCGGGPRASLRVASESGWNCERWARMGGWEERGLPAARVLKVPGASFSLLRVALQRAGWRWRNATFAARPAALRRCGAARLAHDGPPTGDWQRGITSVRRCERERVDKNARILWISAAISGDCPIDAKCDQGFSRTCPTRGKEYARFCP